MTRPTPDPHRKKKHHDKPKRGPVQSPAPSPAAPSPNPPAARRKSKNKHSKGSRRGSNGREPANFEGVPKLPKMNPLTNEPHKQRPEARREEVRAMKRMFDEGYNAVRDSGPRDRPRLVVLNFLFFIVSIVKVFSNLALLAARFMVLLWATFNDENTSSNFFYRVIVDGSMVTLFFQLFLIFADCFLIYAMFKQDSKKLIWLYALSFCLTFFVLTLGALNLAIGNRSVLLAEGFIGSYLAASTTPMESARKLFEEHNCCGFNDPLDWHKEKLFEWDSELTNSRMTIQQNFSWVDECMQRENRKPGDNATPSFCNIPIKPLNVTTYSPRDLRLLIQEEGGIRSSFFSPSTLDQLRSVDGCVVVINRFIQSQNTIFIVSTVLFVLVLPIQTFLIAVAFVNDNAIGRMVQIEGEPAMEKLEKCSSLAFFKKFDQNMGVKHKKKRRVHHSNSEES
ncbi:hypothetical protein PRIPAC_75455 [Pristionchus pacificus]|uniref:Tetraspannin n=1 Tax=Pristionchus pacificus TaxID=54126 RepID=A0A2A6CG16_PRIPA|nr:hypothetical protein PRIPAC_75455 [Pristionchus pacificus]|eukprot:PDM77028.1 Tetraspannin [Pristionchus pacificus]